MPDFKSLPYFRLVITVLILPHIHRSAVGELNVHRRGAAGGLTVPGRLLLYGLLFFPAIGLFRLLLGFLRKAADRLPDVLPGRFQHFLHGIGGSAAVQPELIPQHQRQDQPSQHQIGRGQLRNDQDPW